MGWSFRKSIQMGPLRVNVSRSGVGASVGVRGARVGVGPRGTYVSFAGGGFRYRRKLTNTPNSGRVLEETSGAIHTASAAELADASPEWMVSDSQLRLKRTNFFKVYCWCAGIFLFICWVQLPGGATLFLLLLLAGLGFPLYQWNRERRTARVIYDVDDPEIVERLAMANGAAQWLGHCHALWHIFHAVQTSDWKKNAGAGTLIRRTATRCAVGALPCFELNIEAWSVPVGPQQLLFLPDRLLVWDGTTLAALPYETIVAQTSATRFIEDGRGVPRDAQQVDTTWRFVRRDGGPDLRFNNNAKLPVMRYGELELRSSSGLQIVLQTSTTEAAEGAARAFLALAARARPARPVQQAAPTASASQNPQAVPSPQSLERQALDVATSVATLLRYLAGADRRIDSEEIAFAERTLAQLIPPSHPELARLSSTFRSLPTDSSSIARATQMVVGAGPDYCRWVGDALAGIVRADGKVTPKEVERLTELQAALGL